MVSMRGAAFAAGALGLALFVGGILWFLVVPPHPSCAEFPAGAECRAGIRSSVDTLVLVVGAAALLLVAAVVMLFMHFSQTRLVRPATVGVTARRPPSPPTNGSPAAPPAQPRNRFLDPPVPPRNGAARKP
jgi:hypothetical protein